jgi:hypothetical protein
MRAWPQGSSERYRLAVVNTYEERRAQITGKPSPKQAVLVG